MIKRKKIQEIKSAPELMRIDSRYLKPTDARRNVLLATIIILFVSYLTVMMIILNEKSLSERLAFIFITAIILGIVLFIFFVSIRRRGSSFIITEKGVFVEPDIAEFWENIEEYDWEYYKGFNKSSLSEKEEASCLMIYNKDGFQRNIERNKVAWRDHSMLMQYGIFFTPEQVQQVNNICSRLGIKKTNAKIFRKIL